MLRARNLEKELSFEQNRFLLLLQKSAATIVEFYRRLTFFYVYLGVFFICLFPIFSRNVNGKSQRSHIYL